MGSWLVDIIKVAFVLLAVACVGSCMVAIGGVMIDSPFVGSIREHQMRKKHIGYQPNGPPAQLDMSLPYQDTLRRRVV